MKGRQQATGRTPHNHLREPVSIIEELIPVAMTVYGEDRCHPSAPASHPFERTDEEVEEALVDASSIEGLDERLAQAVEARRHALIDERRVMREQLQAVNHDSNSNGCSVLIRLRPVIMTS